MPPFRAAQIVGARFAFFVSLAHVKDRLKQGDGVFESGLRNLRQIAQILGKRLVGSKQFTALETISKQPSATHTTGGLEDRRKTSKAESEIGGRAARRLVRETEVREADFSPSETVSVNTSAFIGSNVPARRHANGGSLQTAALTFKGDYFVRAFSEDTAADEERKKLVQGF